MNKQISIEDIAPIIVEQMKCGGKVSLTPKVNSMLPLFRNNQDVVTLSSPKFPLKKYTIAFYKRDNGKYVLHRVISEKNNIYTMRGDNQFINESGIEESQIIAVVNEFTRKCKKYTISSTKYKIYTFVWIHTLYIRLAYKMARRFLGRIKRKLIG